MASSGEMDGSIVHIVSGHNDFYFIDWQVASQDEDGNFSTINWQNYFAFHTDDAQLDNGIANLGGATRWSNGGRVYNFASNFTTRNLAISSGSFNIGHDSNGNCTLEVDGGIDVFSTGRSSGSASWSLPQLYQAIAFNSITILNITDVGFSVNVTTDRTANLLQLNIDGAGFATYYSGTFTNVTVNVGGASSPIQSGYAHSVICRIRRNSNGWITDSGTQTAQTLVQNNFFEIGVK